MNVSKTEALMIANMFATMSRADGVVQEIESFTTEALLEGFKTEDVQRMNDRYHFAAYHDSEQELYDNIKNLVCSFTEIQKLQILRSLCTIATSDGNIHPLEEDLIKSFIKMAKLDQASISFANQIEKII